MALVNQFTTSLDPGLELAFTSLLFHSLREFLALFLGLLALAALFLGLLPLLLALFLGLLALTLGLLAFLALGLLALALGLLALAALFLGLLPLLLTLFLEAFLQRFLKSCQRLRLATFARGEANLAAQELLTHTSRDALAGALLGLLAPLR